MGTTAISVPKAYRLTYADWMAFPDDNHRYEVIDGDLFVTPPPAIVHQRVSREIAFALLTYLRQHNLGEVLSAPVGVKLSNESVLEPDLVVVLNANAHRIEEQVIVGPPDIVVEILSPGTARRDLGVKRDAYEAAGVQEYWIVDPAARSIEVLGGSIYERAGLFDEGEELTSTSLAAFVLPLRSVFEKR